MSTKPTFQEEIAFSMLSQHEIGGLTEAAEVVLTNAFEFKELCEILKLSEENLPSVNFENHSVIALFLGEKPTGGYKLTVKKVYSSQDCINVFYTVNEPKPTDFVTMVITQPYCMIRIDNPENKSIVITKE